MEKLSMNEGYGVEAMNSAELQALMVTTLGAGNEGNISAADVTPEYREHLVREVSRETYYKQPTRRWVCMDGRGAEDGLDTIAEDQANPQIAGGIAVTGVGARYLLNPDETLPADELLAEETRVAVAKGLEVEVHGDDHAGKAGCGALKMLLNGGAYYNVAKNRNVVKLTAWALLKATGSIQKLDEADLDTLLDNAAKAAGSEALLQVTPEQGSDAIVAAGGTYRELTGKHNEKTAAVIVRPGLAFDRQTFVADRSTEVAEAQSPAESFAIALGEYGATIREQFTEQGKTLREIELHLAAATIFNLGVSKVLTAEEQGHGEALPVVVLG